MAPYLTALRGQHDGQEIPGLLWSAEAGQNNRQIIEHLRAEGPWLAARQAGRGIFTLDTPDDPESDHLEDGRETSWQVDLRQPGSRGLLQLLLLRHLRDRKVLVDLRTGFVTVRTREEGERLLVDGLELHVEALGEHECLVWANPVQRVLDARPEALSSSGHRAIDLWFPIEGVSFASAHPKPHQVGCSVSIGRRARLIRPGDPCAIIVAETPSELSAQDVVNALRSWFGGVSVAGLRLSSDPASGDELGFTEHAFPDTEAVALDSSDQQIPLDDVFRAALGGRTALRTPRLPPQNFHLSGLHPDAALATAQTLNERAAEWHGVALQFTTEPVPGSLPLELDAKAPVVTQPRSSRAAGQAASLFLECVRRSGGDPWRLSNPRGRWALGIAQAFLYGKMHHLALALLDPSGRLAASCVVPFRFADLGEASFARSLARKLWIDPPADLVVHVDESLDPPPAFLSAIAPRCPAWRIRRRSVPRAFGASSFAWLSADTIAASGRHLLALVEREDGIRPLGMDLLAGEDDPLRAFEEALVLEYAWTPGRAERRHGPASLEWARGLLFQKDRYQPLAQPRRHQEDNP